MESKKGLDFKHKEVINIKTAKRLGFVQDVTADLETGRIKEIIIRSVPSMDNGAVWPLGC